MDVDKYLEPEFDFSRLDLKWMADVTIDEIVYAFKNPRTIGYDDPNYPAEENRWYYIGFSDRSRCYEMLIHFNDEHQVSFIDINLADEYGIERLWCKKPLGKGMGPPI